MKLKKLLAGYQDFQIVAGLAGILWSSSLFFTAITTGGGRGVYIGGLLLGLGWIGALGVSIAWFANVFFLLALRKQFKQVQAPTLLAGYAVILALSSLFLTEIPVFNSPPTQVWGFGLGFILWMLAIFLLPVSVGMRIKSGSIANMSEPLNQGYYFFSIFLLVSICLAILGKASTDRILGNEDELKRLSENTTLLKRRPICRVEPAIVSHQTSAKLPIEIIRQGVGREDGRDLLEKLLEAGIPTIRMGNYDFYYSNFDDRHILTAKGITGEPAAKLFRNLYKTKWLENGGLNQKFVDVRDNTILFEQNWELESRKGPSCPRTRTRYGQNNPKIQLVLDSLNDLNESFEVKNDDSIINLNGTVSAHYFINNGILAAQEKSQCTSKVAWVNMADFPKRLSYHLRIDDKHFFPQNSGRSYQLQCKKESIYLSRVFALRDKDKKRFTVYVEKHNRYNFSYDWSIRVSVENLTFAASSKNPKVIVNELPDSQLLLTVIDRDSDYVHEVTVDLAK